MLRQTNINNNNNNTRGPIIINGFHEPTQYILSQLYSYLRQNANQKKKTKQKNLNLRNEYDIRKNSTNKIITLSTYGNT